MKKSILIIATMAFAVSASAQIGTALVNQAKEAINIKTGKTQVKVDSAVSKTGKVTDPFLPGAAENVKANVKAAIDKKTQAVADYIDGKPAEPAPVVTPEPVSVVKEPAKTTKTKTKATTTKKKAKTKAKTKK
ncbi:MAG: hypothetical protein PHV20_09045 [Bacteroidales bacterium]|nr:hypothetical protein [Bacteroidales bacterium]